MKTGDIRELKIIDMTDDGKGIGKADGLAIFVEANLRNDNIPEDPVKSVVPGDVVKAEIIKVKKNYAFAKYIEMIEPSSGRIPSLCPYFGECGGCSMRELSYESQLTLQREQVRSKLERIAGINEPIVRETVGANKLEYYRNKATFAVGPHGEVGFYRGKSHYVIDIDDCLLQSDAAMVCADALRTFLKNDDRGIKQMIVKTAFSTGEVMVVLESGRREVPEIEKLVEMLDDAVYSINENHEGIEGETGVQFSLESVSVIYGADEKTGRIGKSNLIAGKPTICEEMVRGDGRTFRFEIGPQSFYQTNPEQMVKLYDKALEYATEPFAESDSDDRKIGTLLDIYCGIGTIGIWMADRAEHVIGIESVKPAVIDANRNAVINDLVNIRFIAGRAEEELPGAMGIAKLYKYNEVNEMVEREPEIRIEKVDVAVLDPPRAGCEQALLDALIKAEPSRIVYVSCDAGTLARDVKYLCENGYGFIECTPVDMFPWTRSTECAALMSKVIQRNSENGCRCKKEGL